MRLHAAEAALGINLQTVLVTGGAGYIPAPSILTLTQNNYHVVVIDRKPTTDFFSASDRITTGYVRASGLC